MNLTGIVNDKNSFKDNKESVLCTLQIENKVPGEIISLLVFIVTMFLFI